MQHKPECSCRHPQFSGQAAVDGDLAIPGVSGMGAFYRTQRRMFEGYVCVRAARGQAASTMLGGKQEAVAA